MKKNIIILVLSICLVIFFGIEYFTSFEFGEDYFSTNKSAFFGLFVGIIQLVLISICIVKEKKNNNED